MKILCKIGIHRYDDHIKVGQIDLSTQELPVESKEICRRCGKMRNHVKFSILSTVGKRCMPGDKINPVVYRHEEENE